ncbi:MAG: N-acetylglutaminylglutamine amidotransferase, partial [Gammaproteobacteria bacterium]|nr:N-acetylglutaminylglutamine amidotransferase [Gammaproteobacteria bacterium]
MCGICGIYNFDQTLVEQQQLEKMMQKLERRGPDFGKQYLENNLGLGHRRLAIIDLSSRSHQPMIDTALGLTIVFNGTIYNYKELREELKQKNYQFFSDGDTEVIIKAYHAWGETCVQRLHGMFAFAIWDHKSKQIYTARDRFGIKPFYYSLTAKRFAFASNIQSLLTMQDVDKTLSSEALHHLFTLHAVVPAPLTVLKGIKKLKPGHYQIINAQGQVTEKQYWRLQATRPAESISDDEWQERILARLRHAVKKRLEIADVPVGVLLSGGLDSSLLVALLAEAGVKDLRTFSIGFADIGEEKGSEFEFSDQVVTRYQTQHRKLFVDNNDVLKRLPEAVENMAEPMFGQDAVAFYLLAEQVCKEVKVVQSGQGADEVFGGYFWYPIMAQDQSKDDVERFAKYYFDRDHNEYLQMMDKRFHGRDYTSAFTREVMEWPDADEYIDKVLRFDVTTLIVDDPVKRVDNMTMAWGLEARVPFLDHLLVEEAAKMSPHLK